MSLGSRSANEHQQLPCVMAVIEEPWKLLTLRLASPPLPTSEELDDKRFGNNDEAMNTALNY